MKRKAHIVVCVALHVLFVLLHVVLLVLALLLKDPPVFNLSNLSTNVFGAVTAVIAQGFLIVSETSVSNSIDDDDALSFVCRYIAPFLSQRLSD